MSWSCVERGWLGCLASAGCWSLAIRRNPPTPRNPRNARWRRPSRTTSTMGLSACMRKAETQQKNSSDQRGARVLQRCTKMSKTSTLLSKLLLQFNLVGFAMAHVQEKVGAWKVLYIPSCKTWENHTWGTGSEGRAATVPKFLWNWSWMPSAQMPGCIWQSRDMGLPGLALWKVQYLSALQRALYFLCCWYKYLPGG